MKMKHTFLNQEKAQSLAKLMQAILYLVIGFLVLVMILCMIGRLQYDLYSPGGDFENKIYAGDNKEYNIRMFTVYSNDNLRIHSLSSGGEIELGTYIALVLNHCIGIIPLIFAYYFLSKVFANVGKGNIFIHQNANYLLYYGLIKIVLAFVLPFIKQLIISISNALTSDIISISTGSDMLNNLIPNIAFLVASYIIHHGVNLQDEVDHTL